MIASVDIRLASMLSAVTGAILPAVQDNPFALEQTQLLAGHIQALRTQLSHSEEYERLEHEHTRQVASSILADTDGGPHTTAAAQHLADQLGSAVGDQIDQVRAAQQALTQAVADLIAAQGIDGSAASIEASTRIVLQAEHAQSLRDRAFFAPFGYDADAGFPEIPEMMNQFRESHSTTTGAAR